MLRVWSACLVVFVLAAAAVAEPPSAAKPTPSAEGIFEGPLTVGAVNLRLGFHLKKKEDGGWTGKMDSIDQGARGIPLSSVKVDGDAVTLEFKAGGLKYAAKLSADGQSLDGTFEQGGLKLPLTLKRVEKATVLIRPQEPKKPYPYKEEEVKYENPKAKGVKLAGSLTLPQGEGPFPCVILISGSGPQDRNEELLGHKPFLVLADHLTRNGVAVLRFDDRGVAKSTGNHNVATSADFATDVEAGIDFLKTRKEINTKRIGLMGHSEGGLIAPMVAAARPEDVAFIVLLAGPGLPGDEILHMQSSLIAKVGGSSEASLKRQRSTLDLAFKAMREEQDEKKLLARLKEEIRRVMAELTPEEKAELKKELDKENKKTDEEVMKLAVDMADQNLARLASPWMRYFLTYDPRPTLAKVKCPVLAVNGDLDLQVPWEENLKAVEKALKDGGNADVTCARCRGLNHLFQHTKTGSPSEYGNIEETFDPATMAKITEWIRQKAK